MTRKPLFDYISIATKSLSLSLALATSFATLSLMACGSAVSVSTKNISTQLFNERHNIVTNNKLSINSIGKLRSAGLDQKTCLADFKACLTQLSESQFVAHSPRQLSLLAELHYARAIELKYSRDCNDKRAQCLADYHAELFEAIKYSYAYLFRDSLTQTKSAPHVSLPNELDIQTQDIYNSASNELISTLYHRGKVEIESDSDSDPKSDPKSEIVNKAINDHNTNSIVNTNINDNINDNINSYISTNNPMFDTTINLANMADKVSYDKNLEDRLKKPQVWIMTAHIADNAVDIYMPNEPAYLQNADDTLSAGEENTKAIESLIPTASLSMSGLDSISKRAGFGVSYIAQQIDRETQTVRQILSENDEKITQYAEKLAKPASRISQNGNLLMTAVIKPTGNTINDVLTSKDFTLNLYNPYRTASVNILGHDYPLAGNFSASYAMWIAENNFSGVSYINMLQQNHNLLLPRLFMLEPYDQNKHVIIMVHGLASSPDTWVGVTNDILNDEILRDNFQLWQIAYSTNLPMLENRYYINELIKTAYQQVATEGDTPATQHSVLIGHSMGSIISRMLVSNDDLSKQLDSLGKYQVDANDFEQLKLSENLSHSYKQGELAQRFKLKALEPVDTAVFISAPFRGTNFADRWYTRALRDIIQLPLELTISEDLQALNKNPLAALFLENGASQLSDKSSFITLTKDVQISPKVTYHTIIGNYTSGGIMETINKDTPLQRNSDGIVPYSSSHLAGASSETVLEGGHGIHTNPKTVTQLRKILHEHLDKYPIEN